MVTLIFAHTMLRVVGAVIYRVQLDPFCA